MKSLATLRRITLYITPDDKVMIITGPLSDPHDISVFPNYSTELADRIHDFIMYDKNKEPEKPKVYPKWVRQTEGNVGI